MEIKINTHDYSWLITDDFGGILESGKAESREAAQRAAEMAAAWIQNKTTNDYYGG
jgi:hypothetical protein